MKLNKKALILALKKVLMFCIVLPFGSLALGAGIGWTLIDSGFVLWLRIAVVATIIIGLLGAAVYSFYREAKTNDAR